MAASNVWIPPFNDLDEREFRFVLGSGNVNEFIISGLDLYKILPNPDKFDKSDPDLMLSTPSSEYYSITDANNLLADTDNDSIFHCNVTSLPKNFELLHDLLYCFDNIPDVIAVTETTINCYSSANIDFPNYKFYSTDSKTMAGGVGIYISSSLDAIHRSDLGFNSVEAQSCWIEILEEHKPSIIVGRIYRHSSSNLDNFISPLENLVSPLNQSKHQVFILGNMNIYFLKIGSHSNTEDYLDMLYSSNLLPVIPKPTRITSYTATFIDHIYTNVSTDQIIPVVVTTDISDHLPTLCFIRRQIARLRAKRFFRGYSDFDSETYLNDIKSADWSSILNNPTGIHIKASSFVEKLKGIANKIKPIKRIPRSHLKQKIHKPWILDTLLNSIRNKQKMYRTHFLSKDLDKVAYYKKQ